MDILTLKGLRFNAKHGYYEHERLEGNQFEVDLVFSLDLSAAAKSDDLDQTLDYQAAEAVVRDIMHGSPVKLIETLTYRIGNRLFETFPAVEKLEVRVRKKDPPLETPTDYSEVMMTWQR